jgi:hypothetical protein
MKFTAEMDPGAMIYYLIVEECILLRLYEYLYMIKHDNHVTLLATIYLRANTTHVFIFNKINKDVCSICT